MKPALREVEAVEVQILLLVRGVLRDVGHAFLLVCIAAGQHVLGGDDASRPSGCAVQRG